MKKTTYITAIICVSLLSCSKDEEYDINNLNNNKISILGHGGLGVGVSQYPLDSYEGVEKAISMGADGSEVDVQITKDSVLVLFHDTYLEEATDASGQIYAMNWDEVKNATFKDSPYQHYKIACLDQLFAYSGGGGHLYTFDIKFKNPDQSIANRDIFQRALIRLIEKYHIENSVTLETPDPDFLASLQAKKSGLNLFIYDDYEIALNTAIELGLKGITVKADGLSADQVTEAHNNGIFVAVFGTTRLNHKDVIQKNVDIIQTDDLEDLIARLK
jgi:glycerophosphoryl diester phosphodiesterase